MLQIFLIVVLLYEKCYSNGYFLPKTRYFAIFNAVSFIKRSTSPSTRGIAASISLLAFLIIFQDTIMLSVQR